MLTADELKRWSHTQLLQVLENRVRAETLADKNDLLANEVELADFQEKQKDLTLIRNEIFKRMSSQK